MVVGKIKKIKIKKREVIDNDNQQKQKKQKNSQKKKKTYLPGSKSGDSKKGRHTDTPPSAYHAVSGGMECWKVREECIEVSTIFTELYQIPSRPMGQQPVVMASSVDQIGLCHNYRKTDLKKFKKY